MPQHPRLYKRGNTYYHRAWVPIDIKDTYGKTEETFSLKTKDPKEAVIRVRQAASEVDERFERHRQHIALTQNSTPLTELDDKQIKYLAGLYYCYLLEEDDELRLRGMEEGHRPINLIDSSITSEMTKNIISDALKRKEHFEDHKETIEYVLEDLKEVHPKGIVDDGIIDEVDELLSWTNVNINLSKDSLSRRKLNLAVQGEAIKAYEAIQLRNKGEIIETPTTSSEPYQSILPLLSIASEDWIKEKTQTSWVQKTANGHRAGMEMFISLVGDKPFNTYTKADAREFKNVLLTLPPNWTKNQKLKNLPITDALKKSKRLGLEPMSPKNANKLMEFVGAFFRWADNHYDEDISDIFKGMTLPITKSKRDERHPYNTEELNTLITHLSECLSEDNNFSNNYMFWLPLIALYTGARMNEIAQLYSTDIKNKEGIFYFDINADGQDKTLKFERTNKRLIPIHKTLIDLGFINYVGIMKKKKSKRLFPDIKVDQYGYYSSRFSKEFQALRKKIGLNRKGTTFHSLRHNFEDACRENDIPLSIMNALQGHSEKGMAGRYGDGYSVEKLNQSLQKIEYKGLALDKLINSK